MINAETIPVDIEEMREWALAFKEQEQIGWEKFGPLIGEPVSTLQAFCTGKYAGAEKRKLEIARTLFKFRQGLASRSEILQGIPVDPGYFETPTSLSIRELLAVAHSGKITVGSFAPGLGKSITANDFMKRTAPVWLLELDEITGEMKGLLRALGELVGSPNSWLTKLNADVIQHFRRTKGLLIVDEANFATLPALELLRTLHDKTGVGLCLLGNEELLKNITKGVSFGRLKSRIRRSIVQQMPVEGDVSAFCDAWGIADIGIRAALHKETMRGDSGGLRELTQIVTDAAVLADEDGGKLELAHIKWAIDRRKIVIVRS